MSICTRVGLSVLFAVIHAVAAWADQRQATQPSSIRAPEGFRVELLRSAQADEGSWISMTFDADGAIIVGLDDRGLGRLRLGEGRDAADFEHLLHTDSFRHVRGVLHAHDSLYVSATDSQAVYRLSDSDGDGQYETQKRLRELPYQSRFGHGTNQIVLGPDGMVYVVVGNDVVFPDPMASRSPYRDPQNDWLLPSPHDGGHDDRVGYVARVDPEGETWEVIAGGFRNQFDLAFNRDGEMFTWDADMEWDAGLPWYRPTRLNHVIPGGEYGWRWGSGKWPAWFPDSLPSTLDTGLSSPTGMVFGDLSNWPARFGEALFMADWQFGRILLVDLVPRGATYEAKAELFLEGAPLNVCDLAFGPDGALYFITGGRGSQSGLYRVTWTGGLESPQSAPPLVDPEVVAGGNQARELRKRLERYQRQQDASAIDFIWQQLDSDDPWLRFSARIALENQPVSGWRDAISGDADSRAKRMALLALARVGERGDQRVIVDTLAGLNWSSLDEEELLVPLRALQLTIIRQGRLDAAQGRPIVERLDPLFPHHGFAVNWLLQELLVEFETPGVIERSLDLVENAATQEEQIQYAKTLSRVSTGWELHSARRVLAWLYQTRSLPGGKLVETTWRNLRSDFEATLSESLLAGLSDELARLDEPRLEDARTIMPPRPVVQQWKMDDLIDDVTRLRLEDHSIESGQRALAAAACLQCHRVGQRGGHNGPDLTEVGKRFDGRALLESILQPSRQVDPKYLNATYLMADGRIVTGRTVGVGKDELTIEIDAMTGRSVSIRRDEIERSMPNPVSPMPEGLLDTLTREEVLDLIALLRR